MSKNSKKDDSKSFFVNHKKFLYSAMELAHKSVKLEDNNTNEKIKVDEKAIFQYQECSQRFKLISPFVPEKHAQVLNKYSKVYSNRAHELNDQRRQEEKKSSLILPKALNFRKEKYDPKDMEYEDQKEMRTFSIMTRLKKSILMDKGYFVLPTFYVPKIIWYQKNFRIKQIGAKINFFKKVISNLHSLSGANDKVDGMTTFLKKFDKDLQSYKKAKEKEQIKEQKEKDKKGIFGRKKKNEEKNFNEEYVDTLLKFFDSSSFLTQWLAASSSKKAFSQKFLQVSHQLYFHVLSGIVFKDLLSLLENYFRKCRQKFSNLEA